MKYSTTQCMCCLAVRPSVCLSLCLSVCLLFPQFVYKGDQSRRVYTDYVTVDVNSLLVRVVRSFDHELDPGVTLTYKCRVTSSGVTSLLSCRASVVINDVNDEAPHISFSWYYYYYYYYYYNYYYTTTRQLTSGSVIRRRPSMTD